MTRVTEPPPSGAGQDDYNPFAEEGKPKKDESQVGSNCTLKEKWEEREGGREGALKTISLWRWECIGCTHYSLITNSLIVVCVHSTLSLKAVLYIVVTCDEDCYC